MKGYDQLQTENAGDGQQYIALQSTSLRQQDPTIHYLFVRGQAFHAGGITTQKSESGYKYDLRNLHHLAQDLDYQCSP
jgi:hypothetical protein